MYTTLAISDRVTSDNKPVDHDLLLLADSVSAVLKDISLTND